LVNANLTTRIAAIQQQKDLRGILDIFQKAIGHYGFGSFFISGLPDEDWDVTDAVLLMGGNVKWYEHYIANGYMRYDPIARHCLTTRMPFDWDDATYDPVAEPEMAQLKQEAASHGLVAGLCIPIHIKSALQGGVSLVGDPKGLSEQQVLEVHMLSLYTYGQLRYLNNQPAPRTITEREGEVLKWVAAGKTASEIAEITGLSARTVNQHCENAQKRLGTSNRVHTVVEAVRRKLITL
jgi:LuxR family quorum sensing-dependent transcriptional regulator